MTSQERRVFMRQMRVPAMSFAALVLLLAGLVTMGAVLPFRWVYIPEAVVVLCMVLTVLLVSMEVLREPPLIRVFSALGFFWVMILFGMTLVDYLSR